MRRFWIVALAAALLSAPARTASGPSLADHALETEHFSFRWRSLTSSGYPDGTPVGFDLAPGDTIGNPRLVRQLAEAIERDRERIRGWGYRVPDYRPAFS